MSEICFKKKNDQNINTTQAMAELYTTRFGGSHFYRYDSGFPYAFICLSIILINISVINLPSCYQYAWNDLHFVIWYGNYIFVVSLAFSAE